MNHTIAIEPSLSPIKDFLSNKGYSIESISLNEGTSKQNTKFDAFIVSGLNSNFLGMHDTRTKAVVIDASGMTPEQVYHELQLRLE